MYPFEGLLSDKVAIVTGAAGRLGQATAKRLATSGASVVLADVAEDRLWPVVEGLRQDGLNVTSTKLDLRDEASVAHGIAACVELYGGLDILDNNAGINLFDRDGDVTELAADDWDEILAVNARGAMLMCKHAIPHMVARGGGAVVNISSIASITGVRGMTAYAAAKAALNQLTRQVATRYGREGVRANAIAVGVIERERSRATCPGEPPSDVLKETLLSRLCRPSDVADCVLFLVSPLSAMVTGQIIGLDGGYLAHEPRALAAD